MTIERFWRDPVGRATALLAVVLSLPLVFPILPYDLRWSYATYFTAVPFLLLAIGTFQWRLAEADPLERTFWNLMTLGVGCWLAQQVLQIWTYGGSWSLAFGLIEDLLYVGLYLCLVLALDLRPHVWRELDDRSAPEALNRSGTVVFLFGLLAYFAVVPAALDPESYWAGAPSFTLYIVLDGYLVLRLSDAFANSVGRRWRVVYGCLLGMCSAWLVLDTVEAFMWAEILPWVNAGTPWDLPWMVPLLLLVMAGRARLLWIDADNAAPSKAAERQRAAWLLGTPLILLAMLVPLLHLTLYGLGLFGGATRNAHEAVAFGLLVALGGLVFAYQRTLEKRNRRLEKERRKVLARIEHQAYHDPLTGLPNRRLLADRAAQAIAQADRRGERVAFLFLDLDGFKSVNDLYGHWVGDQLLRQIGWRLGFRVRSSDTLARVGGDEFVVMANDVQTDDAASQLAAELQESLRDPFVVEGTEYSMSASVGVSLYPNDGTELRSLLRRADSAMYRAKAGQSGALRPDSRAAGVDDRRPRGPGRDEA